MSRSWFQLALCSLLLAGCATRQTSVRLEPAPPPIGVARPLYEDSHYRFVQADSTQDRTQAEILVCHLARGQWGHITEVSLANGRLARQPKLAHTYMDFAAIYQGQDYIPLPLHTGTGSADGLVVLPDKIEFDANRAVYVLWFNSSWQDATAASKLEIRKKDLDQAFKGK